MITRYVTANRWNWEAFQTVIGRFTEESEYDIRHDLQRNGETWEFTIVFPHIGALLEFENIYTKAGICIAGKDVFDVDGWDWMVGKNVREIVKVGEIRDNLFFVYPDQTPSSKLGVINVNVEMNPEGDVIITSVDTSNVVEDADVAAISYDDAQERRRVMMRAAEDEIVHTNMVDDSQYAAQFETSKIQFNTREAVMDLLERVKALEQQKTLSVTRSGGDEKK